MSLRSGSPCTSTSRPMSSCSAITRSISARIGGLVGVGGDAPGLVVGAGRADLAGLRERPDRGGGQHRQAVGLRRPAGRVGGAGRAVAERVQPRPTSAFTAGTAAAGRRRIRGSPVSARPSATTSSTFCRANASRPATSGASDVSARRSSGTCSSEQDVLTTTLPGQAEQRRAQRQRARQVRAPHVPAVDHPGDQGLAADPADRRERLPVPWPGHEVQADRLDRAAPPAPAARRRSPRSTCSPAATAAAGSDPSRW